MPVMSLFKLGRFRYSIYSDFLIRNGFEICFSFEEKTITGTTKNVF